MSAGFNFLCREAAKAWGLNPEELTGPGKAVRVSRPRQALYYIAVRQYGFGIAQTGRMIGRDHTTVLHGIKFIEANKGDPVVKRLLRQFAAIAPAKSEIRPPTRVNVTMWCLEYVYHEIGIGEAVEPEIARPAPVAPPVIRRTPKLLATPIREAA